MKNMGIVSLKLRFVGKINSGRIYSPVPKAKAEIAVELGTFNKK